MSACEKPFVYDMYSIDLQQVTMKFRELLGTAQV